MMPMPRQAIAAPRRAHEYANKTTSRCPVPFDDRPGAFGTRKRKGRANRHFPGKSPESGVFKIGKEMAMSGFRSWCAGA
jgi:hypothetical protein